MPDPPAAVDIEWIQVSGPEEGATINSPTSESTSVDIIESGIYEFELTADDGLAQSSDKVQVIVGADSCEASVLSGSYYNSKDFDLDCDVDLADFATFIAEWLTCTNTLEGCL